MATDIQDSMRLVADDCETDAMALEGAPFDGRTVAENFGNLYAMVRACAKAIEIIAERES